MGCARDVVVSNKSVNGSAPCPVLLPDTSVGHDACQQNETEYATVMAPTPGRRHGRDGSPF